VSDFALRGANLLSVDRGPRRIAECLDTADSYGPFVSEELIREALHPHDGVLIATKGGMVRHGPGKYAPVGRPEYLRQCVLMSLRRLRIERIDLWHLHRIEPKVPKDEQFGAIQEFQREGLIRHVGLSQVTVEEIGAAQRFFPVATVQNLFNLIDRSSGAVLDHCATSGIGFIPFFPLAAGNVSIPGTRAGSHSLMLAERRVRACMVAARQPITHDVSWVIGRPYNNGAEMAAWSTPSVEKFS
jgi:pyridoxine 4-dehydrogenase